MSALLVSEVSTRRDYWRNIAVTPTKIQSSWRCNICRSLVPYGAVSGRMVGKQEVRAEQRVVQEGSSPSGARMRGAISKKRGSQPRWPEKVEGMETSKRARRRKLDTAKTDLKPPLAVLRRAGCPSSDHHKMGSEGPAEKYRAVIDGVTPKMNRSA